MTHPLVLIAMAFVLGSIPFGLLIGRARGVDIRAHGSKNIGATNVGRVLGRKWGVLCFVLDFAKGFGPALFAGWAWGAIGTLQVPTETAWAWLAVAAAAIAGHMFPPWLKFKGGKGVATGFGALSGVWPILGVPALVALVVWVVCVKATRYVGVSSCAAALSLPVSVALEWPVARALGVTGTGMAGAEGAGWPLWPFFVTVVVLSAVVVFKHRGNIKRTMEGTESKVGGKK